MHHLSTLFAAALLALSCSCGDDGLNCGPGTVEKDGSCVPADTGQPEGDTDTDADADTDTDTDADVIADD